GRAGGRHPRRRLHRAQRGRRAGRARDPRPQAARRAAGRGWPAGAARRRHRHRPGPLHRRGYLRAAGRLSHRPARHRRAAGGSGRAPGEVRATLVLRGEPDGTVGDGPGMASREAPQWQLDAFADALEPGLLTGAEGDPATAPMQLELHATGLAGDARLRGEFRQGGFEVRLLPSRVHLAEQVIDVDPLELELLGGTLRVTGSGDFSEPGAGRFRAGVAARGLEWGGGADAPDAPVVRASAELGVAGVMDDWTVTGEARLDRGEQQATVRVDGRGDKERLQLPVLAVLMPGGELQGSGEVAWAPGLGWDIEGDLRGFDPGYFAPGWDGAVDGRLVTSGSTREDGGLDLEA